MFGETDEKILVFGAGGHIGEPLAKFMKYKGRGRSLRLATSVPERMTAMQEAFPDSEIICADYLKLEDMRRAFSGIARAFVITPDFLDEKRAMANVVAAARENPSLRQIVRILGDPPGMTLAKVPERVLAFGRGTAIQHLQARQVLEDSGLPITYLNIAAYLMDDFVRWGEFIRSSRTLIMPFERHMTWIDSAELGEAAARIILSRDDRHLDQVYHLNNGSDYLNFAEVADMVSDVIQDRVRHEGRTEFWLDLFGPRFIKRYGPGADEYFREYFAFEQKFHFAFHRSDILERLLGRKPKTLRAWLEQNRHHLL
ncbi:NmrA family NAD(P)-binding protein [Sphingomonas sp. SRS2]|uniref:NmrA family NAD(P)-binding protein n=1 Tax=Sphingomonas sp. SRS2 TaxID=133190 RepID=UPI001364CA14|nr:NmrA family NAD(P)-binding protein [Sphingomonas sp. SRS2]